ncbi:hypothetical protein Tco_1508628 [Tanacetum coccineum]
MYVSLPSITTVRPWFAMIGYNGEIGAKGTLKKSCLPPRWRLLMGQIIQCLDYAKIIWEDLIHKLNKKTREKIVPYLVVGEMHKEVQQVAGGPTSLGDTSEDGATLMEDYLETLKDTDLLLLYSDSPTDEPIIVSDVSEEEENAENDKDTEDTSVPPPSPKSA